MKVIQLDENCKCSRESCKHVHNCSSYIKNNDKGYRPFLLKDIDTSEILCKSVDEVLSEITTPLKFK